MSPTIQHILVPIDFSAASHAAAAYASMLAIGSGAQVHLVHVVEEPFMTSGSYSFHLPDTAARREHRYQKAVRALSHLVGTLDRRAAPTTEVRHGSVGDEITKAAVDYGADLIVMGAHGRTVLQQLLAGSVADRVTRAARCPVMTVRADVQRQDQRDSARVA